MSEETTSEIPTGEEQQAEYDRKQSEMQEAREEHNRRRTSDGESE